MAIKPKVNYPGKIDTTDPNYPEGKAQNVTAPGDGTGTPWEEALVNDILGFQQKLLDASGIVPSGNPDNIAASDYFDALVLLFGAATINSISGLTLSNSGGDTQHDIDISAGQAKDTTDVYRLALSAALTKQIDALFVAGTNAGGLFTGVVAVDTWYAVHAIRKDSDGSIDVGFDTSAIAANIPAGYTAYRRIGWVLTDAGANIIQFFDAELAGGAVERQWDGIFNDVSGATSAARVVAAVTAAPNTIAKIAVNKSGAVDTSSWVLPTAVTDFAPAGVTDSMIRVDVAADRAAIVTEVATDSASQVAYRSSTALATIRLNTLGYLDRRSD